MCFQRLEVVTSVNDGGLDLFVVDGGNGEKFELVCMVGFWIDVLASVLCVFVVVIGVVCDVDVLSRL